MSYDHVRFTEIARAEIGRNQAVVASNRTDNQVSFAKCVTVETEEGVIQSHFQKNSLIFPRTALVSYLRVVLETVLRLKDSEIDEEDKMFVEELRHLQAS
jgi:hypothetical protein